jgi:hypothetical protein
LDELYGTGASAAFARAADMGSLFAGSTLQVHEAPEPASVNLLSTWRTEAGELIGTCEQRCYEKRIHYAELSVQSAYAGRGIYRSLIVATTPLYERSGVEVLTASPLSPRAEYLLALGGFHWVNWAGERWFGAPLGEGSRMRCYREWVQAGRPPAGEPEWHRVLREAPVEGGAFF